MRIAVSVPDDFFKRAERLARRSGRTRSDAHGAALREYVARHAPDEITDALDRAFEGEAELADAFVGAAAVRTLATSEW